MYERGILGRRRFYTTAFSYANQLMNVKYWRQTFEITYYSLEPYDSGT